MLPKATPLGIYTLSFHQFPNLKKHFAEAHDQSDYDVGLVLNSHTLIPIYDSAFGLI